MTHLLITIQNMPVSSDIGNWTIDLPTESSTLVHSCMLQTSFIYLHVTYYKNLWIKIWGGRHKSFCKVWKWFNCTAYFKMISRHCDVLVHCFRHVLTDIVRNLTASCSTDLDSLYSRHMVGEYNVTSSSVYWFYCLGYYALEKQFTSDLSILLLKIRLTYIMGAPYKLAPSTAIVCCVTVSQVLPSQLRDIYL